MKQHLLLTLFITIMIFSACATNTESPVNTADEQVADASGTTTDSVDDSAQEKSFFSNDITSGSEDLLPTIDDFPIGWEVTYDKPKDMTKWSVEDQEKVKERGFIEGYYRDFQKGAGNLADIDEVEVVEFSISLYSKDKVKEVLADSKSEIALGSRTYTTTEEELNDDGDWVDVEVEKEVTLSKLKNPNIGDESLMWSEAEENDFWGEIKEYHLAFIEKNVFVELTCKSLSSETSINNCIDNAKVVSKKI